MGKLSLSKKLGKNPGKEGQYLSKISSWSHKEMNALQQSKAFICIELANGDYQVAKYRIKKVSDSEWQVNEITFLSLPNAVHYCLMTHLLHLTIAQQIVEYDRQLQRLNIEKDQFQLRFAKAFSDSTQFKVDLYRSRYLEVKAKLAQAKTNLAKVIAKAKYVKEQEFYL
jgi:hypothetical protein